MQAFRVLCVSPVYFLCVSNRTSERSLYRLILSSFSHFYNVPPCVHFAERKEEMSVCPQDFFFGGTAQDFVNFHFSKNLS